MSGLKLSGAWLQDARLQRLFDVLEADGGAARVAGGAVRNALLGEPVSDMDMCTTLVPDEVIKRLKRAGIHSIPTGVEHGTVTVVVDGLVVEVTTLREDIKTDGRHAIVRFGTDWAADAKRRDLTINGLMCDRNGMVHDHVGGLGDVETRTVRFIGNAETRIREDALRSLRFFRFFAWYGSGRPDGEGLKAAARTKGLLGGLSVERVWSELRRLLGAPDPSRALLWMRNTGVLEAVLPESAKWGMDAIPPLMEVEREYGFEPDALLRLMAMIRPDRINMEALGERMRMSKAERSRLINWSVTGAVPIDTDEKQMAQRLYREDILGSLDRLKLEAAQARMRKDERAERAYVTLANFAVNWERPSFPVAGKDLKAAGLMPGPLIGKTMDRLEADWVKSGFTLTREDLLQTI